MSHFLMRHSHFCTLILVILDQFCPCLLASLQACRCLCVTESIMGICLYHCSPDRPWMMRQRASPTHSRRQCVSHMKADAHPSLQMSKLYVFGRGQMFANVQHKVSGKTVLIFWHKSRPECYNRKDPNCLLEADKKNSWTYELLENIW